MRIAIYFQFKHENLAARYFNTQHNLYTKSIGMLLVLPKLLHSLYQRLFNFTGNYNFPHKHCSDLPIDHVTLIDID